jgi:hypothetical protein
MRYFLTFIFSIILVFSSSCRKDFDTQLSSGNLSFSKDTVYLDTVFTNIGSSTYNLKVYNKSNHAISIPSVALERGENSFYRLNVDGMAGQTFENIEILAKDSLYIFIETTIDYNHVSDPLYTDVIEFNNGEKIQKVHLATLVRDAHFLYPSKDFAGLIETIPISTDSEGSSGQVNGFYLNDDTVFINDKPYVIYGYCAIAANKSLTIEAGAHIHFHSNSGLIIDENATLSVLGTLDEKVIFESDRLEHAFNEIPGQWGAIWLRDGSKNNLINHAQIKNASIGIIVDATGEEDTPALTVKNTEIYNSSQFGILGQNASISGENLVINNSGQASLACTGGGTYNFTHCTFANYWSAASRDYPCVWINNYTIDFNNNGAPLESNDLHAANFTNCIIDGSRNLELILDRSENGDFNYSFKNNMIKFDDFSDKFTENPQYNFEDPTHYLDNIINGDADFKSVFDNELIIGANSEAVQQGDLDGSTSVPNDILGVPRPNPADLGAYQHINFEN